MAALTFGFLMDPLETVRVDHDSTFALMLEAQRRGHQVRYFEQPWLRFSGSCAESRMRTVTVRREPGRVNLRGGILNPFDGGFDPSRARFGAIRRRLSPSGCSLGSPRRLGPRIGNLRRRTPRGAS